ncbi:hypothetical protein ASPSYDRAFT_82264 [Aspergillus sydowii CBS 593.65]|uniref:DNA repair protein XRCC4 n=1 Tax=Aspergillus sydowii CBS 593.65 TaxID=1036612 RepID=A0A1L9T3T1_9EURO|nr:uncharacterized protein ASPSYDRAFT_82264 [Aspergillus sydowii CBS 593.65]OJJ54001.1 hypothetical protein ASPSYDRAFT_82264 [Aspergillus sydowii CBS 593.65]
MSPVKGTLSPRVLHIRRSDETDSHVLLHVSRSDSTGELTIIATEGEFPYTATCSDDEWKDTVLYVLGLQGEMAQTTELIAGIEASATINDSGDGHKALVIAVRKRIQTITQKIGSLSLQQNDEQGIELFEWSNLAVTRADILEQRFNLLLDRFRTAEDTITLLNKQLEEFISLKTEHDQQLISDFAQLLNEKKLKIRNQQRLLASAQVDPEKISTMQRATVTDDPRPNVKERRPKRPAETTPDESDGDGGFEKMHTDELKQQVGNVADEETDDEGTSTPQPFEDDDNATSDDEDLVSSAKGPQQRNRRSQGLHEQAVAKSPPPRRELPFLNRTGEKPTLTRPSPVQRSPDEAGGMTDDDEL